MTYSTNDSYAYCYTSKYNNKRAKKLKVVFSSIIVSWNLQIAQIKQEFTKIVWKYSQEETKAATIMPVMLITSLAFKLNLFGFCSLIFIAYPLHCSIRG